MTVDAFVYILVAFMVLIVPLNWIAAFLFAALFHELCHIAAVYFLKEKITAIRIGPSGARLETTSMPEWKNILSSAAGPVGSFLLMITLSRFPRLAVCGMWHGIYNLLPVYPLDGGCIINAVYSMLHISEDIEIRDKYDNVILLVTFLIIILAAIWLQFAGILFVLPLLLKEKYLAKKREKGYNNATIEMR